MKLLEEWRLILEKNREQVEELFGPDCEYMKGFTDGIIHCIKVVNSGYYKEVVKRRKKAP